MLRFLKPKCGICKKKAVEYRRYRLPGSGNKVSKVCLHCSVYAERRAYRKV